jgi:glycosyltransferase involved in cell wall biosynthesis
VAWIQGNVAHWLRGFRGVFHGTFNQLPWRPSVPTVVTIHDLSFEVHPEGMSAAKRRAFQMQARRAARIAERVVAPSDFTRGELIEHYDLPPERVVVTPWGVEPRFHPSQAGRVGPLRRRFDIRGRYVVAMGGAPRRGLDVAVEAWRSVCGPCDPQLVVVGPERAATRSPGVIHAGPVDDRGWAVLLAGAEAFCYPTRYEGFGVPALESIASGTPVVCAPVASLPEVLGDAAEWCDEPTVPRIAAGLDHVLHNPARSAELRRRGIARAAAHPSWEESATTLLAAYHAAGGVFSASVGSPRSAARRRGPLHSAPT